MSKIGQIADAEAGSSVRGKLNEALAGQDFSATFDGAGEEIVVGMRSNFHHVSADGELQKFIILCWTDEFRTAIDTAATPSFKVMTTTYADPTTHGVVDNFTATQMVAVSGKATGSTASTADIDAADLLFIECVTTGGAKLVDISLEYGT